MSKIDPASVVQLRKITGAGIMSAKQALEKANGDQQKAIEILRQSGEASAAKKADRVTEQGLIDSYLHNGKIGVLIELACETDFVAKTDDFKDLVHDLAMHVAANSPDYISQSDVPQEQIEQQRKQLLEEIDNSKPQAVIEKIIEGKLKKYFASIVLLKQPFLKDPDITVENHLKQAIAKFGENIAVIRFVRYELGQ